MNRTYPRHFSGLLLSWAMILLAGTFTATRGEDTPAPAREAAEKPAVRTEAGPASDELARVKEENAQLRKENQQLRRLLAEKSEAASVPAATTNSAGARQAKAPAAAADGQLTYWLTSSSGKRHNSGCRYFKTTEGRLCGPDEGTPCKLCGG